MIIGGNIACVVGEWPVIAVGYIDLSIGEMRGFMCLSVGTEEEGKSTEGTLKKRRTSPAPVGPVEMT